jgi:hypothetical protein
MVGYRLQALWTMARDVLHVTTLVQANRDDAVLSVSFLIWNQQLGDPGLGYVRDRSSRSRLGTVGKGHGITWHPCYFAGRVCAGATEGVCERRSDADRVSRCRSVDGFGEQFSSYVAQKSDFICTTSDYLSPHEL